MLSYGFMGDVMVESENYRWLGPLRYDVVSWAGWGAMLRLGGRGECVMCCAAGSRHGWAW